MGRPRGSEEATFPLVTGVRYRVSMNPGKSHLLMPGTDHSYCGLTLALDHEDLMTSGYEDWYWIVEDNRDSQNWCKPCSSWQSKWRVSANATLPEDSPVSSQQWEQTVGAATRRQSAALDRMAATVSGWLGGTVVDE